MNKPYSDSFYWAIQYTKAFPWSLAMEACKNEGISVSVAESKLIDIDKCNNILDQYRSCSLDKHHSGSHKFQNIRWL